MEEINCTHSSRKSWNLLGKLGTINSTCSPGYVISNNLFKISNIKTDKYEKAKIKLKFGQKWTDCEEKLGLMNNCTTDEVNSALKKAKYNKAAGVDGIFLPEFLKNLRPRAITWLAMLFTKVVCTSYLPKLWHKVKVIAILKTNKDPSIPNM